MKSLFYFVIALFVQSTVVAAPRSMLPQDELAKESVLPKFDNVISVKNRMINTTDRLEVAGFFGLNLTEAIFSTSKFGFNMDYHFDEDNAINIHLSIPGAGLSSYGDQLYKGYKLDFTRAPAPSFTFLAAYEPKYFYGKMSLSKDYNMNLSLYGLLGGGFFGFKNKSYPGLSAGLGQKFYLNNQFSFRFDLRANVHQAPNPFLANRMKTSQPAPTYDDFKDRLAIATVLDFGVSFLF
jgi:outer membrane beta-barrel protein